MMIRCPRLPKHHTRHPRRGASIVEFALVVPILLALLLAILESAWFSKNYLAVANAAREGARSASLGRSTSDLRTRIKNAAKPTTVQDAHISFTYSTDNGTTYYAIGDSGTQNSAPSGSLVRLTMAVPHQSLTRFFPFMNNRTINVSVVMRRETT
jgi:Flp pilus assembly protein TadG